MPRFYGMAIGPACLIACVAGPGQIKPGRSFTASKTMHARMRASVQAGNLTGQFILSAQGAVMKGAHAVMRGIETPCFTVRFQNHGAKEGTVNFNNMGFKHWSSAFTCPHTHCGCCSGSISAGCSICWPSTPWVRRGGCYIASCEFILLDKRRKGRSGRIIGSVWFRSTIITKKKCDDLLCLKFS